MTQEQLKKLDAVRAETDKIFDKVCKQFEDVTNSIRQINNGLMEAMGIKKIKESV